MKSRFEYHLTDPAIDQHSAAVKKCEGSIRTGIRVCRAQSVVSGSTLRIGSRHFSQSVFLHVKWPARNLSYDTNLRIEDWSIARHRPQVNLTPGKTKRDMKKTTFILIAIRKRKKLRNFKAEHIEKKCAVVSPRVWQYALIQSRIKVKKWENRTWSCLFGHEARESTRSLLLDKKGKQKKKGRRENWKENTLQPISPINLFH